MLNDSELRTLKGQAETKAKEGASLRAKAEAAVKEAKDQGVDLVKNREAFDKVDALFREAGTALDEASDLRDRYSRVLEARGQKVPAGGEAPRMRGSMGARVTSTDEYAQLREDVQRDKATAVRRFGSVEVATRDEAMNLVRTRAIATPRETLNTDDRMPGILDPFNYRPARVLDLVTIGATDSDAIDYVAETAPTEAVAEAPHGATPAAAGNLLPESSYGFEERSVSVKRIGHFTPATEAQVADAAQFRTLVDSRLVGGVQRELERLVVAGSTGGGDPFDGVMNTAGINTIARDGVNNESRWDVVRKAITRVAITTEGEAPDTIGLHPNDYETLALEKDSNGNYVHGHPASNPGTIWGLKPVVSTVFTEGTPVIGNFDGAYVWLRDGIAVTATDTHSDWFLRGWLAIKAQVRAAMATVRPTQFATVTGF